MPIYEFQCKACGKDSEVLVQSSDWKGTPCPKCGSKRLMKKLSVFASAKETGGPSTPPCGMGGGGGHSCSGGCCGFGKN